MDYNKNIFGNNIPLGNTKDSNQDAHERDCVTLLDNQRRETSQRIADEKQKEEQRKRAEKLQKLQKKGLIRRRVAGASLGMIALTSSITGAISFNDYITERNISKDISNRADGYTVEEVMDSPVLDYVTPELFCSEEAIYNYFTALEKYDSLENNPNAQILGSKEASDLAESAEYIQLFTKTILPYVYTAALKEEIALASNLNTFETKSYISDDSIIHYNDISIKTSTVDNHPYISVNENGYNSFSLNCDFISKDVPLCYKTAVNDVLEITGSNATDNLSLDECIDYGKNFKGLLCTYLVIDSKGNFREVDTETFKEHAKNVRSNLGAHYDIEGTQTASNSKQNTSVQQLSNLQIEEYER